MNAHVIQLEEGTYRRISKSAAFNLFKEDKRFYICPVNLMPGLPFSNSMAIFANKYIEHISILYPEHEDPVKEAFDYMVRNFAWYNCTDNETGMYPAFYVLEDQS